MKRISVILIILVIAFLVSCGNNPTGQEEWPDGARLYLSSILPDTALSWSPYGDVLLFTSFCYDSPCIYGFDGLTTPVGITSSPLNEFAGPNGSWNASQGKIVYTALSGDSLSEIRAIPGNIGAVRLLLRDSLSHLHPTWSPDGDSLLMCTYTDEHWGLWKAEYNEDSLQCESVYTPQHDCLRPSYSPDGEWILFQVSDGSQSDIWLIHPDGSDPHAVIENDSDDIHPCWGAESDWFAFASDRSGYWDIWISDTSGNTLVQVTDDPGKDIYPAWNPGHGWFVFSSDRSGSSENYDIFYIEAPEYK